MKLSQIKNFKNLRLVTEEYADEVLEDQYAVEPTLTTTTIQNYEHYRDPCGHLYRRTMRYFEEADTELKEEHFLKRLVNWAPNGSILWTYAFSNISDELKSFADSEDCSYYFGGKKYHQSFSKEINNMLLIGALLSDVKYKHIRTTKKKLKEIEELLKTCQIIDLGWEESRDYQSLRDISDKMINIFSIRRDDDFAFLEQNIYKYIDWVVSIYKTITEIEGYSPRMSDPIYEFELEWANHHKFSKTILEKCIEGSKTLQVFMYFSKAL